MLSLPPALSDLIHQLKRLPGIGPKAAERLALSLLKWQPAEVKALADVLADAISRVSYCPVCGCLSQDGELCAICDDGLRDPAVLCVVETSLDAVAMERGGSYGGRYHVLGGALSPVKGVLPDDLRIAELLERVRRDSVREVIVATNASPDGEATALYLKQELEELHVRTAAGKQDDGALSGDAGAGGGGSDLPAVRITRLARGLPSGSQLDYADAATLQSALEHRTQL